LREKYFTDEIIDLRGAVPIGKGRTRVVYRFPEGSRGGEGKCIKIESWERLVECRKTHRNILKRIRGPKRLGETPFELDFYRRAEGKDPVVFRHVPRFYGMVRTTLGDGMTVDYIDGVPLDGFVKENGITARLIEALKELFGVIVDNAVVFRDARALDTNWFVREEDAGRLRIIIIDGLGTANLIPIAEWFYFLGRRKAIRRIKRVLESMRRKWAGMKNAELLTGENLLPGAKSPPGRCDG
jgi:hypothetical protein